MFDHMAVRAASAESLKQLQTYDFETLTQVGGLLPAIDESTSVVAGVRKAGLMPANVDTTSAVTDVREAGLDANTPAWINAAGLRTAPGNHQDGTEAPRSALGIAAALVQTSPPIVDPTASSAVTTPQPCETDVGYFSTSAATRPRPMQMDMGAVSEADPNFWRWYPSPEAADGGHRSACPESRGPQPKSAATTPWHAADLR